MNACDSDQSQSCLLQIQKIKSRKGHPEKEQNSNHFLLLKNRFGRCIGENHPSLADEHHGSCPLEIAKIHHVSISNFYKIENLGKCTIGGKNYTLKEERELKLILGEVEGSHHRVQWRLQLRLFFKLFF